ncbi:serine hydrolase domain-containing protein [Cohnella lupini]|uniref:CubicO group peptidase (Beta-lactamase class C family) n=1 Tax=Cohnella lupini TaxID=1294267 RepID=A0A3D9I164_9BACL|nr:serine hydrolase domain-containing protein [Cohnella lupini]RED55483.1 CubicO group peptidase (beta-lactamase class C family) [Cohnella lupini]
MRMKQNGMLTAALVAALLVPTEAIAAEPSQGQAYVETQKAVAEKAALLTGTYGTTSVQYALIDQGRILVSGQSGKNDEEGKVPLTAKTTYGTGSTSKMFTTAAVMKLVDDGKIDLDNPVTAYVPEFKMKDERYKEITTRMLLNHSSGLQGSSFANSFLFEDNDTYVHDRLLEQLADQTLKADPGAYSVYCNDGFTLAEIIVERVSGTGFSAYIHTNFTESLGMADTKTPLDNTDGFGMAATYFPVYQGQLPTETINAIGAGGIYSTAEDLVRFSQIFSGQKEGILSDESVEAMEQAEYNNGMWPDEADNSFGFGLGWDSVDLYPFDEYGIQAVAKGGDTILYHAALVVLPEENMAAAVLSSGGSSSTNQLLANEMLLHALKEKGEIAEFKHEKSFGEAAKAVMPEDVPNYAGMYGSTNQLIQVDIAKTGELSVSLPLMPNLPAEKYVYTTDGSFMSEDGTAKVSFVTEENGRTYIWVRMYASLPNLGQTALSHYSAEKLSANEITDATAAAWEKRDGNKYYLVNEKYTSLAYLLLPALQIDLLEEAPGYVKDKKITGPDTAASDLQIPMVGGRDTMEYRFLMQDGVEYLEAAGSLYVSEDALKPIYAGKKSLATIPRSGLAKWYTIPEKAAGKTMTVKLPAKGSFTVYDANGALVNFSVISGNNKVVLPQKGVLIFAGEAGSAYNVSLK